MNHTMSAARSAAPTPAPTAAPAIAPALLEPLCVGAGELGSAEEFTDDEFLIATELTGAGEFAAGDEFGVACEPAEAEEVTDPELCAAKDKLAAAAACRELSDARCEFAAACCAIAAACELAAACGFDAVCEFVAACGFATAWEFVDAVTPAGSVGDEVGAASAVRCPWLDNLVPELDIYPVTLEGALALIRFCSIGCNNGLFVNTSLC